VSAREDVLGRIRSANRAAGVDTEPVPVVPRDYAATGGLAAGSVEVLDLLEDRLVDYRATVRRCAGADVADTVRAALDDAVGVVGEHAGRVRTVVVPPGLPPDWVPGAVVDDGTRTAPDLDLVDAVVTAATVAAAVTGTIVLDGSPDQGRRAISLVPDVHVCVLRAAQVVHSVPEMLARLEPTRPTTFVSGPSATSDIELERVEGVHGPRTLSVVLVTPSTSGPPVT